jgi:hypothetical protein
MITCDFPSCNNGNVWTIKDENPIPPVCKEFNVCNDHLTREKSCSQMYAALNEGRYEKQDGNSVIHSGYVLTKNISTWHSNSKKCSFSSCEKTKNIWDITEWEDDDYGYPFGSYVSHLKCNEHLPRKNKSPHIALHGSIKEGISTLEETWLKI